jgi:uncharacterized membrane protein
MTDPDGDRFDMMNDGGYQMMGDGGGWVMGLVAAVLVLLLVALLAAVACLDGRLARGEVSPDDYRAVRALLDAG